MTREQVAWCSIGGTQNAPGFRVQCKRNGASFLESSRSWEHALERCRIEWLLDSVAIAEQSAEGEWAGRRANTKA